MNYEEYKKAYFTNPVTESRYGFSGSFYRAEQCLGAGAAAPSIK